MDRWTELNNRILAGDTVHPEWDRAALRAYFEEHVNPNTVFFHDLSEKIRFMVERGLWDGEMLARYRPEEVKAVFNRAYSHRFRFQSFMGAQKFYAEYATKTPDKSRYLERYEDRMSITALARAGGNAELALTLVDHLVRQTFVPATPTLMNSGKANTGRLTSCFLLQDCTDSLDSIMKTQHFAADLSKNGGGVGIDLSNLRARGESLRHLQGVTKGAAAVAKLFDVLFRYADQAGQRQGAAVVNLNVMHPDFQELLAGKKIATDEDARLKTLSICAVIPDVFMQAVRDDKDVYQVYPRSYEQATGRIFTDIDWDTEYASIVENPNIRKRRVSARQLLQEIALTQGESGYPYLLFTGNANRANPVPNVGTVKMTNLCSEIMQPTLPSSFHPYGEEARDEIGLDVSCNLASLHIGNALKSGDLGGVVRAAISMLDDVAQSTNITEVPAVARANREMRSIGLGAMGLHGHLAEHGIAYGSPEALAFCDLFFEAVHFHARRASMELARDTGFVFAGFQGSRYQSGEYFAPYTEREREPAQDLAPEVRAALQGAWLPTREDWRQLVSDIQRYGLAHSHVMAIAPTGSISYVANATASVMPITERVETRTSGKGKTIYPMPGLNEQTEWFYEEAYDMDMRRVIDTVATIQRHVDQGISCTLFVRSNVTTADLARLYISAYRKGLKSLYYLRQRRATVQECVACAV
ncbi:class 1b ribonucleoside-diphosphate reductase subunit alpha [Deinococcus geothermalis]|uniref:class 1b ribonucleoside-diphosphate reductase subunit alpha n=1 Tax=Deinococcus geothermalis TaxID=68909 RepID=UPI0023572459|nr:class 1b ribonucleoside-diphosphate reductase subunit alpha [Deinococcus geothermalis]